MRRFLIVAAVAASMTLAVLPAHAATECVLANVAQGEDEDIGDHCELTADANQHAYVAATANSFRIYLDLNSNDVYDPNPADPAPDDVSVVRISTTGGDAPVGELTLTSGTLYDVEVENGCGGPVCGWAGVIVVR